MSNTQEPFGYFKAEPFGWTDCAETDEGAQPMWDNNAMCAIEKQRDDALTAKAQYQTLLADMTERCHEAEKQRDELQAKVDGLTVDLADSRANDIAAMRTGEVDAIRGYAVTRLHTGDDYARIDFCINGFLCLIERLMPDFDLDPLRTVSKRLANGVPLTIELLDSCAAILNAVEDRLITIARRELIDAANTELTICEIERLGLDKEAA